MDQNSTAATAVETEGFPIRMDHVGPVTEFEYVMQQPGVHVLKGNQGAGKTTILRTVQWGTDGTADVKPQKTDGVKKGEAQIGEKILKIARAIREEGDVGLDGMGDLNIGTLHWPRFEKPEVRDKYRIATLVRLADVPADLSMFRDLLEPAEWDEIIAAECGDTDDLVDMACKVKRSIERKALDVEKQAEAAATNARSRLDAAEGVETDGVETDEDLLDHNLEQAIRRQSALEQQRDTAEAARTAHATAIERLEQAKREYDDPTSVEAETELADATRTHSRLKDQVAEMEAALTAARQELAVAGVKLDQHQERYKAALSHEHQIEEWQAAIDDALPEAPTALAIEEAAAAVKACRDAINAGSAARRAMQSRAEANAFLATEKKLAKDVKRLRQAAQECIEKLSDAIAKIPGCPLKVRIDDDGNARLVIASDRSESEHFDELSDGERWRTIIPLCCRPNRLLVLPQAAWGELSPASRAEIDRLVREAGAYLLTAEADNGELRAEPFAAAA